MCFVRWGECSLPFAFIFGIHHNLSLVCAFTLVTPIVVNVKDECQGRMQSVECQRVLNPNAQNVKQTLNLVVVVHNIIWIGKNRYIIQYPIRQSVLFKYRHVLLYWSEGG